MSIILEKLFNKLLLVDRLTINLVLNVTGNVNVLLMLKIKTKPVN